MEKSIALAAMRLKNPGDAIRVLMPVAFESKSFRRDSISVLT